MTTDGKNDPKKSTAETPTNPDKGTPTKRAVTKDLILRTAELSEISGLHPGIESLQNELSVPPFKGLTENALNDPAIRIALRRNPIWAIRIKNKLLCVGNITTYLLLKLHFEENLKIHYIEVFNANEDQIRKSYLCELLYAPALFGIHSSDQKKLVEIACRANSAGMWHPPLPKKSLASDDDVINHIAKVYGADKRKFKAKTDARFDPPHSADDTFWESI